jgi:hypothetical protein
MRASTVAAQLATACAIGPSIIHIVADDLGWNDVDIHGSGQIPTPTIRRLGAEGVRFDQFYVNPVCSPTRSAMMSGRQTIHTGIYSPLSHHTNMGLNTSCNQPGSVPCKLLPGLCAPAPSHVLTRLCLCVSRAHRAWIRNAHGGQMAR